MVDDATSIIQKIQQENVKFIDFRFTDLQGKFHHISMDASLFNEELLLNGIMFDSSSIAGWHSQNPDLLLIPDIETIHIDPFYAQSTMIFICNVYDPITLQPYNRDPRYTTKKAIEYLKKKEIGDTLLLGIKTDCFIFDNVHYTVSPTESGFTLESTEFANNGKNKGHYSNAKSGYTLPPQDKSHDMRSEIVSALNNIGVQITKYHNQANNAQHSFNLQHESLLRSSDNLQKYKYAVHQVANSYCKTATFMPKPIDNNNGSGMHLSMSIRKEDMPVFAGDECKGLSKTCLYYIGGIIKHAKALNALTNASTNSYKRLLTCCQSPVQLVYSTHNRSASCRIPYAKKADDQHIEIRFPDLTANPYLAPAAILMAGLDGIANKIHPGKPMDKNINELSSEGKKTIPRICYSLREALENLDNDREFLKKGNVFDDDQIDAFIKIKMKEVLRLEQSPSPVEFEMYYSI
ncbi:glutamine synthetase protein [Candidatus Liberibacter solanacearum CLso-ZC1]|uniref:Glutamine synthetase I beta n=2 Tax=Candidatus Liberibacter solanacearum TaxID=556287 RepID=E4UDV6_LIBSC|nr:type I glutamate--ammonia ligase [Candidatus Liberibacter solanacearum]ADR52784.1 glutamine synthetase protein [Candidatus Liberibacter solanacearum CLso-ZC1]